MKKNCITCCHKYTPDWMTAGYFICDYAFDDVRCLDDLEYIVSDDVCEDCEDWETWEDEAD